MKALVIALVTVFSSAFAQADIKIICENYQIPSDCNYEPWELRAWECSNNYPFNADGEPYDMHQITDITVQNNQLTINEENFSVHYEGSARSIKVKPTNIACVESGLLNCETSDRKLGFYLDKKIDFDNMTYFSITQRNEKQITTTTYGKCQISK